MEAGLWLIDHVPAWLASPLRDACMRVLIELPEGSDPSSVGAQAELMLAPVREATAGSIPVLLHGEASYAWPALRHAVTLGLQARIGLEDVLTLPDGSARTRQRGAGDCSASRRWLLLGFERATALG